MMPDALTTASLPLSERAYQVLRDRITRMDMRAGEVINEGRLMEELGMSRTPIREAVKRLQYDGLAVVLPRRGTLVSDINVTDLPAISEARLQMEPAAARFAARRVTRRQAERIDELLDLVRRDPADHADLIGLDRDIHMHVYACVNNRYIAETLARYYTLSLRIWFLALERVAHLPHLVHEHIELLEAIRDGDSGTAEDVLARHIIGCHNQMQEALSPLLAHDRSGPGTRQGSPPDGPSDWQARVSEP